eukprot:UN07900
MQELIDLTGLTQPQVNYFLVNSRTRLYKPAITWVLQQRAAKHDNNDGDEGDGSDDESENEDSSHSDEDKD